MQRLMSLQGAEEDDHRHALYGVGPVRSASARLACGIGCSLDGHLKLFGPEVSLATPGLLNDVVKAKSHRRMRALLRCPIPAMPIHGSGGVAEADGVCKVAVHEPTDQTERDLWYVSMAPLWCHTELGIVHQF
jgi:hypothetical protein